MAKKTGQIVQNGKHIPWFELSKAEDGWQWCLWSGNGRGIAISGQAFRELNDCKQSVRTFLKTLSLCPRPKMMVDQDHLPPKVRKDGPGSKRPEEMAGNDSETKGKDGPPMETVPDDGGNGNLPAPEEEEIDEGDDEDAEDSENGSDHLA